MFRELFVLNLYIWPLFGSRLQFNHHRRALFSFLHQANRANWANQTCSSNRGILSFASFWIGLHSAFQINSSPFGNL